MVARGAGPAEERLETPKSYARKKKKKERSETKITTEKSCDDILLGKIKHIYKDENGTPVGLQQANPGGRPELTLRERDGQPLAFACRNVYGDTWALADKKAVLISAQTGERNVCKQAVLAPG